MSGSKRLGAVCSGLVAGGLALSFAAWRLNARPATLGTAFPGARLEAAPAAAPQDAAVAQLGALLPPQAALVDARRGEILESLRRTAECAPLEAWVAAQSARARPSSDPNALLAALCRAQGNHWSAAILADRSGRLSAAWPVPTNPKAPPVSLAKDPYFAALIDPSMGPGIVRHGYAKAFSSKASQGKADLVAACGLADPSGAFGGLLKIRVDVRQLMFGAGASPYAAFLAGHARCEVLLALGSGQEIYNSAKDPLTEDLSALGPDAQNLLLGMVQSPSGIRAFKGPDGAARTAVWQRVGSVAEGAVAGDVLSLLVFVPNAAPAAVFRPAAGPAPARRAFYAKPQVCGAGALALLCFVAALGLALRGRAAAGPGAEAPDEDGGAADAGEAPVDAPETQVLGDVREELAQAQAARRAAELDAERERKLGLDAKAQMDDLRSALETSKRDIGLAAAENRTLAVRSRNLSNTLEEKTRASDKADALRRENEAARLAAVNTLSTELRATLEVIKNYINTLLGGQGAITDAQQEFLGVVINKSARLERMIGDLVEMGEISSGNRPPRLESLMPGALVQDAMVNVRPQAENKNIALDLVEKGLVSRVQVDREKIGGVLRGLLGQAIKVSPKNEKISLQLSERESTVELRVTDSGMSLPSERAAKVFAQFHGVDSQAGPEFIGSGLRFTIFKSVVEANGGTLWIESQAGKGKTFVLALPKAAGLPLPGDGGPLPPPVLGGGALPPLPPPLGFAIAEAAPAAGLPALGPVPAMLAPPVLGAPAMAPAPADPLAALLALPPPPAAPPKPASPEDIIASGPVYKPAPLDESLNAPWKRKDVAAEDELGDLIDAAAFAPPLAPEKKPDARPGSADTEDFDRVFGSSLAAPPPPLPKVELSTNAKPSDTDLVQFSAVFGAARPAPPPKPAEGLGPDFDALFGPPKAPKAAASAPPEAPAAPKPAAPQGLNTLDDLNDLLGQ